MRKILYILPLFVLAFTLTGNPPSGWYQQFMPNLNGQSISDILFLDSLTGFAITGDQTPNDTNYILRTTNGGDNWSIIYQAYRNFLKVQFINNTTGFVCGGFNTSSGTLLKTTDGGDSWVSLNTPGSIWYDDMSVLNEDTIWLVQRSSLDGGVYRTTNGGVNWENQFSGGSSNPEKIYMYNGSIGFIARNPFPPVNDKFYKTTNSGNNWFNINNDGFRQMQFIDSLTGWKATGVDDSSMKKTTDGGITWSKRQMPSGGYIQSNVLTRFSIVNEDTIWGSGGYLHYPNNQNRGIIYRTTNGGDNWHYQVPDTSLPIIAQYEFINFTDSKHGWVYTTGPAFTTGLHTTIGGDTIWITNIKQLSNHLPDEFILYQNYPNPFNPSTNIKFIIKSSTLARLSIYDITGKELAVLVNGKLSPGEYEYKFDGNGLSSGVYFYSLFIEGISISTKKMMLTK